MNTRDTFIRKTSVWVALGVFAAGASAQLRPLPGRLNVGHSEQGNVASGGIQSAGEAAMDPLRVIHDGGTGDDGPTFGTAAEVEFRSERRAAFIEAGPTFAIVATPLPSPHGRSVQDWAIALADSEPERTPYGPALRVPTPGALALVGLGALLGPRRRR